MKKIYTLLLSAAVAVSASAAAPVAQKAAFKAFNATHEVATVAAKTSVAKAPAAQAPAKAIANIDEVFGTYKVHGEGMFSSDAAEYNYIMTISAGEEANEVLMANILDGIDLYGEVDLTAGTISVPMTNLGKNQQGYDIVWGNITLEGQNLGFTEDPVVFKVTETGLEVQTIAHIIGLAALQNGTFMGCFNGGNTLYEASFTKFNPDEQWEDTGLTVQYTDGLFLPFFEMDPETWEVKLQKSKEDPSAFALVDPYKELIEAINQPDVLSYDDAMVHRMVFHVDGSDIVWFEDFNSGASWSAEVEEGQTQKHEIIFETQIGALCQQYGAELVASVYPDAFGHFENGTITYPVKMKGEDQAGNEKEFNNWLFVWGDYAWGANAAGAFKISGLPTPAGVKDIAVDTNDENAPVEYFNLQGARVSEPAAGLYIRRQGKTVTKVVIK